ncbi:hypothetical protein D9M71_449260 [compost metagenome]
MVAADDDALALGAAHQAHAQLGGELLRFHLPGLVQRAVVTEGDQGIAGQGGEELHLEQLERQHLARLPAGLQTRHQLVDAAAGDGEVVDQHRAELVARLEHGVVAVLATGLAPQAEFGAQAVMLAGGLEDFRFRGVEGRQQRLQALRLLGELGGVGRRVELGTTHQWKKPILITKSTARITSAGLSSLKRPARVLIAAQAMKPKAMPSAME